MQDYYHVLGITLTATALEIWQACVRARTRLKRRPAADPIFKAQLAEVEVGYDILGNPRRRIAYDIMLADEPPARLIHTSHHPDERLLNYARVGRRPSWRYFLSACYWFSTGPCLCANTLTKTRAAAFSWRYRRRFPTSRWITACTPSIIHFDYPAPSAIECAKTSTSPSENAATRYGAARERTRLTRRPSPVSTL